MKVKQDIVRLLTDRSTVLESVKKLNRDHKSIQKVENIGKEKKKVFKNITKTDMRNIKRVISKKNGLIKNKLIEEADIVNAKRENMFNIKNIVFH